MKTASIAAALAVMVLVMSGCACGPGGCVDGSCDAAATCADGICGGGVLGRLHSGLKSHSSKLAGHQTNHHRGPQAHYGPTPGPANGPAAPTVTYPYYTTRGPRDFLAAQPPSIGP
jgi:hypothetical protein